jgi:hypothetical protein
MGNYNRIAMPFGGIHCVASFSTMNNTDTLADIIRCDLSMNRAAACTASSIDTEETAAILRSGGWRTGALSPTQLDFGLDMLQIRRQSHLYIGEQYITINSPISSP